LSNIQVDSRELHDGVQVVEVCEDGVPQLTVLLMRRSLVFTEVMQHSETLSPEVLQAVGQLIVAAGGRM